MRGSSGGTRHRDLIATLNDKRGATAVVNRSYAYNALNRPLTFSRENADGTSTVITADYDKAPGGCKGDWTNLKGLPRRGEGAMGCTRVNMGRRVFKKVETVTTDSDTPTETRTIITHHRYLYRGYLQIAALDLTRTTLNALWYITWDPTESPRGLGGGLDKPSGFAPQGRVANGVAASQPVATRPLAIQQSGTWYTYGIDLPKNVTELYGADGYIKTTYTYSPYGNVTSTGNASQPIQWSSEFADTDLALVYYNYRYYNSLDGRWTGRDSGGENAGFNLFSYLEDAPLQKIDILGLESSVCNKRNLHDFKNFNVEILLNTFMERGKLIASSNDAMLKSILTDTIEDNVTEISIKKIAKAFPSIDDLFEAIDKYSPGNKFRWVFKEGASTASYVFISLTIKTSADFCCCKKGRYCFLKATHKEETTEYGIKFFSFLSGSDYNRLKRFPENFRNTAVRAIMGLKGKACN